MTLIEAAKTMLADSLLSIPFWAEAVNTACYVQNRALVTKPHNKTPYELLLGRTPSIGFMRPFGCHVTILNTLDPLGKFDGKADEGFLVGNYVSRNRPTWLFDINTLTKSMNYQPVIAGNQPNPSTGIQEHFDADKAGEGNVQQYVLFPLCSAKTKKHDDKTKREAKGKSPIELSTGVRNLSEEFKDFFDNSINEVNVASTLVHAVGQISTNSTNTFSIADPSNTAVTLEDITYSDDEENVGEEADFSNLETNITVSPIPITRVYKDHYKQDRIFISQDKYVAKILRKFGLTDEKLASTPINTKKPLLKDPNGEDVDVHTYWSMIGSLMYLTSSRPDIMFVVCACTCFEVSSKASHLHAVKRIFRYLKGKPHLVLWYPKDSPFNLVAYSDSDYVDATLDRKSTIEGCQFLGCRLIYWQCKKQKVVATYSTEAEYVAAINLLPIDTEKPLLKDPDGKDVDVHTYRYLKGMPHLGLWYPKDSSFNLVSYSDSDYAGASLDRKSTIGGYQFLGCRLISWQCKKWTVVTTLSTEAKYVAAIDVVHLMSLDDAESIDCLPNAEIFTELERMGYEKPSTKLTFYKAFFSAQWKFLIHTILQCRKFNFSKYIFDSLVRNLDSSSKFYMYPRFLQLMIVAQVGDLSSHTTKYTYPTLTQKVFANIRRVGKGFSRVDTPLFEGMLVPQQATDVVADDVAVDDVAHIDADAKCTPPSPTPPPPQQVVTSTPPLSPHQSPIV
nr:uncharacterized mitochondrial protein AtMg00810-like [Tanacetum cinerariifolium]